MIVSLNKQSRKNIFKKYSENQILKVIYNILFNQNDTYRSMDEKILNVAKDKNNGYESMGIARHYGLISNHKGIFEGCSIDDSISILKSQNYDEFKEIIEILEKYKNAYKADCDIDFINTIKNTSMSKSYKIPILWAFYNDGHIKLKIDEEDIYNSFKDFYSKQKNGVDLEGSKNTQDYKNWGKKEYVRLAKNAPIKYLSEGTAEYFYKQGDLFCISDKMNKYINDKEFIKEFKDAIQGLEDKYYKRERNNLKESDEKNMDLQELISSFEKNYNSSFNDEEDEKLRKEFISKFPIESLKILELEKYALGKQQGNLCWWLEYNTIPLGSIKGGNAKKFKIYYANKEDKWVYPNNFSSVEEAWNELRNSICNLVNNFKLEKYELLNDDSLVTSMNMFKTKLLYMYFPEKLLPVYSLDHIQRLLMYFGYGEEIKSWDIVKANMELKSFQNNNEQFTHWNGLKFMRFVYWALALKDSEEDKGPHEIGNDVYIVEDIKSEIDRIYNHINNQGYNYTHEQLSNLYLSLKTKPFVILAGISGTGKSKIVRLLAESLGATSQNEQFNIISVRPDWNDSTELIGYKNINDQFIDGQLTKIIKKAINNKNKPYFVCLDEMNLARVEYYLSDYLSIIESRKNNNSEIITDLLIEESVEVDKLYIPQNLYLIGTVNMDDTTFTFSRKVLDRANTIEFSDVDLENLFNENEDEQIDALSISNEFLKTTYLKTMDIELEHRGYTKVINKKIIEINEILKKSQKQFAYRVRDEILFYMIENKKSELLEEDLAFDYQIMQKILPAISGSERSIGDILVDLFNYVCEKTVINDIDIEEARNYLDNNNVKYKNSAEKIIYMLKGYENDGYVSYWY